MRTHWKPGKNEKNPFPPTPCPQNLKGKTLSACLGLPIGCMKLLFLQEFDTIFGVG
jgi:hypothetical protein